MDVKGDMIDLLQGISIGQAISSLVICGGGVNE